MDGYTLEDGYWSLIKSHTITDIGSVSESMYNKLKENMKSCQSYDYHIIVSIVVNFDGDELTLNQLYRDDYDEFNLNKLDFSQPNIVVNKEYAFMGECYRNDNQYL